MPTRNPDKQTECLRCHGTSGQGPALPCIHCGLSFCNACEPVHLEIHRLPKQYQMEFVGSVTAQPTNFTAESSVPDAGQQGTAPIPRYCIQCSSGVRPYGVGLLSCRLCGKDIHQFQDGGETGCYTDHMMSHKGTAPIREFASGATRDSDDGKLDYEGFISPLVWHRFAQYMHKHRVQPDGSLRDSDNWQRGIPKEEYVKSLFRHFVDLWLLNRGFKSTTGQSLEDILCAIIFNAQGRLHVALTEEK